jgi:hypothetical protein
MSACLSNEDQLTTTSVELMEFLSGLIENW